MGDVHGTLRVLTPTISAFVAPCPAAVCSPWSVTTEPKWTWTHLANTHLFVAPEGLNVGTGTV